MSFESCLRDAAARGEMDPDEAEDVIARFRSYAATMGRAGARARLMTEMDYAAAIKRRQTMLTVDAHDKMLKDITGYKDPKGRSDVIEAANSLFEDFGHAGYPSARFIGEALIGHFHSQMADFLEHFERKTLFGNASVTGTRMNKADLADVRRAMRGEDAPPVARGLGQMARDVAEQARQLFNEKSGETIPKLKNWTPQSHDSDAVIRAGGFKGKPLQAKNYWSRYIDALLDWTQIRDPFTNEPFGRVPDEGRRMAILGHAWDTIVTDGRIDRKPTAMRTGGSSVANSRSDHRFFVFKDAESQEKYNREFGTGDFFTQFMDHIHGMARDIAMMDRFGPNPAAQVEWLKGKIDEEAAKQVATGKSLLEAYPKDSTTFAKAERAKNMLDGFYEQYRGANAAKGWLAIAGTILRNNAMGSLLGSAAIAHASSNWFIQSTARYMGGIPIGRTIPDLLASLARQGATRAELLRAGLDVEQGMFSLGAGARQMGAWNKVARWSRWLPDRTTHLTGLIPIVDANKAAFHRGTMSYLADLQGTNWANLPERVQTKLKGYGLNEADWKIMQLAQLYTPDVGSAKWLRHPEVMNVGNTHPEDVLRAAGRADLAQYVNGALTPEAQERAQKIAFTTAIKMLGYMSGEREVAVPQSSMRASAIVHGKEQAGTFWGELRRSAGMFKGFIGSFMITQIMGMQRELARGKSKGIAYIAAAVIGMSLLGMVTLQLKQMSAGKDAAPMNPFTMRGLATWAHGILTSGSLGVLGDFLVSDLSSFGRGLLETLAGPAMMGMIDPLQGAIDLTRNKLSGANKKPWQSIVSDDLQKFLRGNTPIASTAWYLRAAYQRIILDQLQYLMDRNAHFKQRQVEERLQKETGQHMYWRPGRLVPDRLPAFTP